MPVGIVNVSHGQSSAECHIDCDEVCFVDACYTNCDDDCDHDCCDVDTS